MKTPENINGNGIETMSYDQAEGFLDSVRGIYRSGYEGVDYRGRRSEDQGELAMYATLEAEEYFDAMVETVVGLGSRNQNEMIESLPATADEERITLGGVANAVTLRDMKNSWQQLWSGFSILNDRIGKNRDAQAELHKSGFKLLQEMKDDERFVVMNQLFNDFQELNALRFGAQGSGVPQRVRTYHPDTFEPIDKLVDRDLAESKGATVSSRAAEQKYTHEQGGTKSTHTAGKLSPDEVKMLRRQHPQVPTDEFFDKVNFYKDVVSHFAESE